MTENHPHNESSPTCCCGGSPDAACKASETTPSCGCGEPSPRQSSIKNVLAVIILLAAIGVGAVALLAK
jgi:hypothetical protein